MIPGIDVSHHNGIVDWHRAAASGIRFAFVRTGDGITTTDRQFARNWEQARACGVVRGPYHFLRASVSGQQQADALIGAVRGAGVYALDDLPPVCDLEDGSLGAGVRPSRAVDCALAFAQRVEAELGRAPILYTSPYAMSMLGRDVERLAGRYPTLWIAHYTDGAPKVPDPYRQWAFWQHSADGRVPGIGGPVDLDWYRGDLDGLRALVTMSEVMAS